VSTILDRAAPPRDVEARLTVPAGAAARGGRGLWATAGRRERLVFRAAMAVCAIAVLDDAFVHPELGTSAGDHVVSGLVPVAVAVVLAVAYPRLRAGLRGALALTCAPFALTAGVVDGVRQVALDGPRGDDVTALLALAAGAVLAGLGIVVLWRSRRLDRPPWRRYGRRALIGVGTAVVGMFVLFPAVFAIVATHRAREPVKAADLGRPYEDVAFTTGDGLRLAGWYVPSRNRAAVIAFPGRRGPVDEARLLARHGYGVLLLDRRGEGESEGDPNAYGWGGEADLKAAAGYLSRRADVDPSRIGGLGLSVGGEMLLHAAAEDTRLRAVISEGASVRSIGERWDDPGVSAIRKPFSVMAVQTAAVAVLGNQSPPPSLMTLVDDIAPRPLLLIRGLAGQPSEVLNRTFRDRAGPSARLWEVPRAGHTAALSTRPREYERRVVGFFDRALLGR
jgi:hypothetical protein